MNKFWKIEKEWVNDWGLTWTEAGLLSDMLEWPCQQEERAERCKISSRQVRNLTISIAEKISGLDRKKFPIPAEIISVLTGNNFRFNRKKFPKKPEKISAPPTPPYIGERQERQERQAESARARTREESSKKNQDLDTQKKEEKNSPSPDPSPSEIILSGIRDFYESFLHAVYLPDFRIETTATQELADKLRLVMEQEHWLTDPDSFRTFWNDFLHQAYQSADPWQRNNFDIRTLNSQFNNFYLKFKNGNQPDNSTDNNTDNRAGKGQRRISDERLRKAMLKAAGIVQSTEA